MMSIQSKITTAIDVANQNQRVAKLGIYLLLGIVFLFLLPFTLSSNELNLINRGLIFGLFAMGYDFMYGYSGMVSFGHAALFGLGAYSLAVAFTFFGVESIWLLMILAIVGGALYSLIIGTISIRTRDVYFAILTLAFAQVVNILIIQYTNITGGNDGLTLNLPDWTIVPSVLEVSLYDTLVFYYIVITSVALTYLVLRRLTNSPMGAVFRGIRENVDRLEYIGINERRYRIMAFTVSGAVSGLAGGLYAIDLSFIGPGILTPVQSGEVIIWTIIGGRGTLLGPLFGGALIFFVEDTVSQIVTWWLIPVGILFITIVIFAPDGIAGWAESLGNRLRKGD